MLLPPYIDTPEGRGTMVKAWRFTIVLPPVVRIQSLLAAGFQINIMLPTPNVGTSLFRCRVFRHSILTFFTSLDSGVNEYLYTTAL